MESYVHIDNENSSIPIGLAAFLVQLEKQFPIFCMFIALSFTVLMKLPITNNESRELYIF